MSSISGPLRAGAGMALLAILFGFLVGGAMGGWETAMKRRLQELAASAPESAYRGDTAARDQVVAKAWTYIHRAHLHGGAIGTAALTAILALVVLGRGGLLANLSGLAFGAGALLYPVFWLLAANLAPRLGSTAAAKKSLELIAVPGAGLCILGLLGTILALLLAWIPRGAPTNKTAPR